MSITKGTYNASALANPAMKSRDDSYSAVKLDTGEAWDIDSALTNIESDSENGKLHVNTLNKDAYTAEKTDAQIAAAVAAEATARSNADNALQNNIDAEESARKSADNALQDGIDKNAADILAETTNRTSVDTVLDGKIADTNKSLADTKSALETADAGLQTQIDTINGKIPTQASTTNQLADKDFVNSSINNMAAFYITSNADGDAFAKKTALLAGPWYSQGAKRNPTINDYAIVLSDESKDSACTRYMYDGAQWDFQYVVNDTPMTAAQVAAINSTITKDLVDTYNAHVANSTIHVTQADKDAWNAKQDALTTTQLNATNSGITSTKVASYDAHIANKSNPHSVTATQIGLGNVDNTSDADKPISTATQTALDGKVSKSGDTMSGDLIFGKNTSLYLSDIGSTVANTTSRLNLGTPDKVYAYLAGNTHGAFGIYSEVSGTRKGIACYPSSNFFADATTKTIDLGRSDNVWKTLYADTLSDGSTSAATATVISGAAAGATAVQPASLSAVATSGSYNDLSNKPTIPTTLAGLTGDVSISSPAEGQHLVYDGSKWKNTASSASISWGGITGTLSNQSDLQTALNAKQAKGNYVTTDTTQTVTGVKTFQQGSDTALVKVQNSTATLGVTPTAEKTTQVRFDDENGDWIGLVSGKVGTDGSTSVELCVRKPDKSGSGFISIDSDASGNIALNASDGVKNSVKSWVPEIVGQIISYAGTTAPAGYLACDGSAISRTTYANLFAVIGTTYGEGDGSTTFNLPDATDRVLWGASTPGYLDEQLPNIQGTFPLDMYLISTEGLQPTGAIRTATVSKIYNSRVSQAKSNNNTVFELNASLSNSAYTDNGIVRPKSVGVLICIKY